MKFEYSLSTPNENFYNITEQVQDAVTKSGIADGLAIIICPHTTAGITVNENADPEAINDILLGLSQAFPMRKEFKHGGGNSDAHIKALVTGSSATVPIENGKLVLGFWQAIYFCEYDPPRNRKFYVNVIPV